jgi:hypothetical protein
MYRLGQKVIVVADEFEQGFPVGCHGFIVAYDRNPDNAFDYIVRIPAINKNVFVPKEDVALEEVLIRQEVDRIEKEALLDFSLVTKNEALFRQLTYVQENEREFEQPLSSQEKPDAHNFIRLINLKAWI